MSFGSDVSLLFASDRFLSFFSWPIWSGRLDR